MTSRNGILLAFSELERTTINAPTVLVAAGNSSETDHDKNREAIVEVLNGFGLPMVGVKVVRASTYRGLSTVSPAFNAQC